jgi:pilus assembly protein CpaC
MKVLPFCVLLALSMAAYGQQPGDPPLGPATGEAQPDTTGLRLQQLLFRASELQRVGQPEQAAIVLQQAEWERRGLLNRIDALQAEIKRIEQLVGSRQQVLVHLKVMEVSLTKLKKLGYDVTKLQGNPGKGLGGEKQATPGGAFSVVDDGKETLQLLDKLQQGGLSKVVAEPTLVTISGQEATFHSGGKLAIPTRRNDGSLGVEYQNYGAEVQLKPDVLVDRSVRLAIHCRLSEVDYANATQVGKDTVPGIRSRDIVTDANIQYGRTLVIYGLVQHRAGAVKSGVPWLGDIPYAGAAFSHVKEFHDEIATLVLITPEVVEPLGDKAIIGNASPAAAAAPPTDANPRR